MNVCLIPFCDMGWGQSAKTFTRPISALQKRTVRYTAGLNQLISCSESETVYLLYIQEIILYAEENCNWASYI
jgi:hypothetical protein